MQWKLMNSYRIDETLLWSSIASGFENRLKLHIRRKYCSGWPRGWVRNYQRIQLRVRVFLESIDSNLEYVFRSQYSILIQLYFIYQYYPSWIPMRYWNRISLFPYCHMTYVLFRSERNQMNERLHDASPYRKSNHLPFFICNWMIFMHD